MTTFETISPVDGAVIETTAFSTDKKIEQVLNQPSEWPELSLHERLDFIRAFIEVFSAEADAIATDIALQMGRPKKQALGEVLGVKERADYMMGIAERALQHTHPIDGSDIFIQREPLGKVLVIAPWNYPYLTAINTIIPALIAGNQVILKHASQTPRCAKQLKACFERINMPSGAFEIVFLTHETTKAVINSGQINFVSFTGSVESGRRIKQAASNQFINVGLELGGKDAALVLSDCDMEQTVASLVDGAFFNSGQSCCGIERIYVEQAIFNDFVAQFCALTRRHQLGNPLVETTTLGPMVSHSSAAFVRKQIQAALNNGAKALIEESRFRQSNANTAYLAPQVLIDVNHQMSVMTEESFGPVVGIMPVTTVDEGIALVNDSRYGLTASVWCESRAQAFTIGHELQVGTVFHNRCDYLNPALAWTGVKDTGVGVSLSALGYQQLTRPKSFSC